MYSKIPLGEMRGSRVHFQIPFLLPLHLSEEQQLFYLFVWGLIGSHHLDLLCLTQVEGVIKVKVTE